MKAQIRLHQPSEGIDPISFDTLASALNYARLLKVTGYIHIRVEGMAEPEVISVRRGLRPSVDGRKWVKV